MQVTIYHNPKCSKSRCTLDILGDSKVIPRIVNYLITPPSKEELQGILSLLGLPAQKIIRFKETIASELGISPADDRTEDEWLTLLIENPILIERPIVVANGKAVIGRPPEVVQTIL